MSDTWDKAKGLASDIAKTASDVTKQAGDAIKGAAASAGDAANKLTDSAGAAATAANDKMVAAAGSALDATKDAAKTAAQSSQAGERLGWQDRIARLPARAAALSWLAQAPSTPCCARAARGGDPLSEDEGARADEMFSDARPTQGRAASLILCCS